MLQDPFLNGENKNSSPMRELALDVAEKIRAGALRTENVEWNEEEDEEGDNDVCLLTL